MPDYTQLPFAFVSPGEFLAAAIVLPLVCMVLVALRFYVRWTQKQAVGIEDYTSALALVLVIGMGVCFIIGYAQHVMGYPTPLPQGSIAQDAYTHYIQSYDTEAKIEFYYQLLMILAYGLIKLSLVFFYRRLFLVLRGSAFDIITIAYIAVISMWTLAFFFLFLFTCKTKVDLHWAPLSDVQQQCGDPLAPELGLVISDLATDIMILVLPLPIIWRLKVKWTRKLAITFIFLVGLIAIAASITRMVIYIIVSYTGFSSGYDIDQTVTTMLYWSMIEASLGLMTSCLPVLSVLIRRIRIPDSLKTMLKWTIPGGSNEDGWANGNRQGHDAASIGDLELNWIRL